MNIKNISISVVVTIIVALSIATYFYSTRTGMSDVYEVQKKENMTVGWVDKQEVYDVLPKGLISGATSTQGNNESSNREYVLKNTHFYKVGTFTEGTYKGADIIITRIPCEGPCSDDVYYFVQGKRQEKNSTVLLANHSGTPSLYDFLDDTLFSVDATTTLSELMLPEKIEHEGKSFSLMSSNVGGTFFDDVYTNDASSTYKAVLAFTHKNFGTVFTDDKNGFYIKAKDGTVRNYALDMNFYDKDHSMPSLTWNDGTKNIVEYSNTDKTGCGSSNFASVVQKTKDDLITTGKTSFGDDVYELKNKNDSSLKGVYETSYNPIAYGDKTPKMSYDKFVKAHPLFFWYDSMGRLIKFQNATFMPQAECGKPVIYLYPEKEMDVSVKVSPRGGMSVSIPPHHDGWKVRATQESVITEKSTGSVYPYLFWEGNGAIYETPKKGFVVEKGKVHNFLLEKLHALGLNEKETGDFMEFWEPKMKSSPYYFVTFLGNQYMNDIAPLAIEPKPDTIIRVLMDFIPLQEKVKIEGYEIHTPQRKGFTVVEWGGVLR